MIDNIGGVTSQLVGVTLDALMLRHNVIANNIANVHTPGFHPQRLNFEQQLQQLFSDNVQNKNSDIPSEALNSFKASLHSQSELLATSSSDVQLDSEMVALTENTLRYQALLTASSKRGDIIKMAVREGRQ